MTLDGTPLKRNSIHLCGYYVGHAHHTGHCRCTRKGNIRERIKKLRSERFHNSQEAKCS
jgi:hypothetical protein